MPEGRFLFRRFVAALVDWVLIALGLSGSGALFSTLEPAPATTAAGVALAAVWALVALPLGWARGASLGMRVAGLRLTRPETDAPPGAGRAVARFAASVLFLAAVATAPHSLFGVFVALSCSPGDSPLLCPDRGLTILQKLALLGAAAAVWGTLAASVLGRLLLTGPWGQTVLDKICRIRVVRAR